MKKGAMFGLDARIALAIFGALSVISGAALYSAIQETKATAVLSKLNELGKAFEAYYIDTGSTMPRVSTDTASNSYSVLQSAYLVEDNSVTGWKGPYTAIPVAPDGTSLLDNVEGKSHIMLLSGDADWTLGWTDGKCNGSNNCAIWARFYPPEVSKTVDDSLAKAIDEKVDGGDGAAAGKFRWFDGYNLQIMPIDNPS